MAGLTPNDNILLRTRMRAIPFVDTIIRIDTNYPVYMWGHLSSNGTFEASKFIATCVDESFSAGVWRRYFHGIFDYDSWKHMYPTYKITGFYSPFEFFSLYMRGSNTHLLWKNDDGWFLKQESLYNYCLTKSIYDFEFVEQPVWYFNSLPTLEQDVVSSSNGEETKEITLDYRFISFFYPTEIKKIDAPSSDIDSIFGVYTNWLTGSKNKLEKDIFIDESGAEKEKKIETLVYYGNIPIWKQTPTES